MAIEKARIAYLAVARQVWSVDATTAALAGEIVALMPDPPIPAKRSHRLAESRTERLVRWRFDVIIAATAMVTGMPLIHNNPSDFEAMIVEPHPMRGHQRLMEKFRRASFGYWLPVMDTFRAVSLQTQGFMGTVRANA